MVGFVPNHQTYSRHTNRPSAMQKPSPVRGDSGPVAVSARLSAANEGNLIDCGKGSLWCLPGDKDGSHELSSDWQLRLQIVDVATNLYTPLLLSLHHLAHRTQRTNTLWLRALARGESRHIPRVHTWLRA